MASKLLTRTYRRFARLPGRIALAVRHARTPTRRVVVVKLLDHYRFGPYLLAAIEGSGSAIEVVNDSAYAPDIAMLRRMRIGMVTVRSDRVRPTGKTLVTDDAAYGSGGDWRRRFVLDYDYYGPLTSPVRAGDRIIVPYFMHPNVYETGLDRRIEALRSTPKRIRVFFAGTVGAVYTDDFAWPILNRSVVMATVLDEAGDGLERVARNTDRDAFLAVEHDVVVSLTDVTVDTLDKHPLTQAEMLRFAAGSNFFVNPPGWRVPHCHNVIEAMAVGAIPITNYGDLFDPPLEDGHTCLRFVTADDLRASLQRARSMPEHDRARMRANVLSYYDERLAPKAFAARLRDVGHATLHILNERLPVTVPVPRFEAPPDPPAGVAPVAS